MQWIRVSINLFLKKAPSLPGYGERTIDRMPAEVRKDE